MRAGAGAEEGRSAHVSALVLVTLSSTDPTFCALSFSRSPCYWFYTRMRITRKLRGYILCLISPYDCWILIKLYLRHLATRTLTQSRGVHGSELLQQDDIFISGAL